jgi:hypothetical protein
MKHFKQILFILLLFSTYSLSLGAEYESEIEEIKAEGRGQTKEEAILNAKLNAMASFAEFFSVQTILINDELSREVVGLLSGAVREYEVISSYINDFEQTVIIINAKLSRDSMQALDLFGIDPDRASMNVNGSFFATENAKWRFNEKGEIKFLNHLLEKIKIIGKNYGFTEAEFPSDPVPRSVGKRILQNRFNVDYYASKNMNTVYEAVRTTLQSLSVSRGEYMTIPTREIFEVELCTDAMLFGERFEQQRRKGKIPDCEYETYYLRNSQSIEMLQTIEDYVRSEIKSTIVVRQYNDNSCKMVIHARFDEKKHASIKRIDNERRFSFCFNNAAVKKIESIQLGKESPYWPQIFKRNGSNKETFSNNLTFNTCNVDYRKSERVFFPISRECRAQIQTCAIPYKNAYGDKDNVAYGLNLPLGGELIARKTIIDNLRETDYSRLNKYKAVKNGNCN